MESEGELVLELGPVAGAGAVVDEPATEQPARRGQGRTERVERVVGPDAHFRGDVRARMPDTEVTSDDLWVFLDKASGTAVAAKPAATDTLLGSDKVEVTRVRAQTRIRFGWRRADRASEEDVID